MKAQDLEALRTALLALRPSPGAAKQLYRTLLAWALDVTGADEGGVLTVSQDGTSMRIEEWQGKGVDLKSRILPIVHPPTSICARAVLARELQTVPDVRNDPQYLPVSESPIQSLLAVPILTENAALGVINLESSEAHYFTQAHASVFRHLAAEIAPFWGLVQTAVREFRYLELLRSLQDVSKCLLADPPDLKRALGVILQEARRLTGSDLGGVCLLSFEKDTLIVDPAIGAVPHDGGAPLIPRGHGFTWLSMSTGEPQNIPDVTQYPDRFHDLSGGRIRSLLCAPMLIGGEPIGVLNMESTELNHFSLTDQEVLAAFADQAASTVSTLRLRERFAAADAMAGLGSLSGNLTHRLNNTVGGIRILSELLSQQLAVASPELKEISDDINGAAREALQVVEQYEGIAGIEERTLNVTDVVTTTVRSMTMPSRITLHMDPCEPSPILTVNENALGEIVRELVRNAVKSLDQGGNIWVSVRRRVPHVVIEVADDGERIPPSRAAHIFERGYSSRPRASGTGFGLWMIQTFLTKCGGKVSLLPRDPRGNAFQLYFPERKGSSSSEERHGES